MAKNFGTFSLNIPYVNELKYAGEQRKVATLKGSDFFTFFFFL